MQRNISLTKLQARRFLLLKHGLLGTHKFIGKTGVLEFVRQAGCLQFDPVDACGKNAELTLQSRVRDFTKEMLHELLYCDRQLIDFPDKNLSILPVEAWPFFARYRRRAREGAQCFPELPELEVQARRYLNEHGPASSDELPIKGDIHWHSVIHWSGAWGGKSKAARAVLEQLYANGELVIHHKNGTRKYYDLAEKHLPAELLATPDPLPDDSAHIRWRILRRIGAVGLLWNRPSTAWLNIWALDTASRQAAFAELLAEGAIMEVKVHGVRSSFFCRAEDLSLLESVQQTAEFGTRCEVLAPLDCLLWDRKLIQTLFDFNYAWEIYTPAVKRKYGYYVLPLLYGDAFVGRVEAVAERTVLTVKNLWFEDGVTPTQELQSVINGCMKRFAKFNHCNEIRDETSSTNKR